MKTYWDDFIDGLIKELGEENVSKISQREICRLFFDYLLKNCKIK